MNKESKKKILFLHKGGDWMRGSEYSLLSIIKGLQARSYDCTLWSNAKTLLSSVSTQGVSVKYEEFPYFMLDPGDRSLDIFGVIKLIFRIYRTIRSEGYQVVYCNGALPAQAGYIAAKLAGVPIVCHVRATYPYRYIQLFNMNRCDTTIFVSNTTRDYHLSRVKFKNPVTVYNGIDPGRTKDNALTDFKLPVSEKFNSIRLCQIGAVVKYKGMDTIIEAMEILKKKKIYPYFYLAGKGEHLELYRTAVQNRSLDDQIIFLGEVTNITQLLAEHTDVTVLATSIEESFGRVIVEGYFEGKPAIGSITGGIPEVIDEGKTGLLFERKNAAELAKCIRYFHDNRESIQIMGENGREHAKKHFSDKVLVENVHKVVSQL